MSYAFFPGCAYHSAAGYKESVDAVCAKLGMALHELEDWNCCGATAFMSRDKLQGMALVGRLLGLARRQGNDSIVTVCNACYTTIRKGLDMLGKDPEALRRVNAALEKEGLQADPDVKIRHLLEVMLQDLDADAFQQRWAGAPEKLDLAAYYGCQLTRPWGGKNATDTDSPERPQLLEEFFRRLGHAPVDFSASTMCCGASHAVPYAAECAPLAQRIARAASSAGAQAAVAICPMCQLNVDAGQRGFPIVYFTQLAALALGCSPKEAGLDKLLNPFTIPERTEG